MLDKLIDQHKNVHKTEQYNDVYSAVSGVPNKINTHAMEMANFILDLIKNIENFKIEDLTKTKPQVRGPHWCVFIKITDAYYGDEKIAPFSSGWVFRTQFTAHVILLRSYSPIVNVHSFQKTIKKTITNILFSLYHNKHCRISAPGSFLFSCFITFELKAQ